MKTFEEWWRSESRPFGTAYEIVARKAWNAAFQEAAEDCESNEPGSGLSTGMLEMKVPERP